MSLLDSFEKILIFSLLHTLDADPNALPLVHDLREFGLRERG
ncbi:MAG TPA: hypothetical protein VFJ49_13060 [Methyloceanibacter sp.]|nr:hypothetical protein [Methyloceanibacter sp.]